MEKDKRIIGTERTINLYEPMFFWVFLLGLGLVVKIVLANTVAFRSLPTVSHILYAFSIFVLSAPGFAVLPLIVGAIIGSEAGSEAASAKAALKSAVFNSMYASAIYFIAIVVLYEVDAYAFPSTSLYPLDIIGQWILMPILIVIVVSEILSFLAYLRRM